MWPWVFFWLLGAAPTGDPPKQPLLVSAAVSLTEALTECGEAFTAATGVRVRFNFGPSNVLARQIVQGAPVDVFVSADVAQMRLAERAGAIAPGSTTVVVSNQLAVIVPGDRPPKWTSPAPLGGPSIRRIAVGDPTAVPAGVYARTWLRRVGLWDEAERKLVPASSARGALAAVRTGAVDAGIVYRSDASHASGVAVVLDVSGPDAPLIEYPAAVVQQSRRSAEARQFIEFLRGTTARQVMERRGFARPGRSGTR